MSLPEERFCKLCELVLGADELGDTCQDCLDDLAEKQAMEDLDKDNEEKDAKYEDREE